MGVFTKVQFNNLNTKKSVCTILNRQYIITLKKLFMSNSQPFLVPLDSRPSDIMAFIPGNHKDTIQQLCFYNLKLGAPLSSIVFPIKGSVFHSFLL